MSVCPTCLSEPVRLSIEYQLPSGAAWVLCTHAFNFATLRFAIDYARQTYVRWRVVEGASVLAQWTDVPAVDPRSIE